MPPLIVMFPPACMVTEAGVALSGKFQPEKPPAIIFPDTACRRMEPPPVEVMLPVPMEMPLPAVSVMVPLADCTPAVPVIVIVPAPGVTPVGELKFAPASRSTFQFFPTVRLSPVLKMILLPACNVRVVALALSGTVHELARVILPEACRRIWENESIELVVLNCQRRPRTANRLQLTVPPEVMRSNPLR